MTTTGWYAVVIGPMAEDEATSTLKRLKSEGQIPRDSLISDGNTYVSQLWPLSSANIATTQTTATAETTEAVVPPPEPALIPDPDIRATRLLEKSWTREEKKQFQTYMVWTGDYDSAIDGAYGRGTRAAISQFQERNGFEPTGYLSADQVALLAKRYNDSIARLGVQSVRDLDAGIEILMPAKYVHFTKFEPPFVHYGAKDGSRAEVILISQQGDRESLQGLYDIMETFDYVPAEGYRVQKRDWFVLSGRDEKIASYSYARLEGGIIKGFSLIWTPELDADMTPFATAMYNSFAPIQDYVLDETIGFDSGLDGPTDLANGLETAEPARSESGFFVNEAGTVVTHSAAVAGCRKITINNGKIELALLAQNDMIDLVVLKPTNFFAPPAIVQFSTEAPMQGADVSVAGFSYPDVMEVAVLNFGTVTDVDGLLGDTNEVRVSAYLEDGDAGGPVLDDRGAVIGMQLRRDQADGNLPDSVNFALKSKLITELLTRHEIAYSTAKGFDALEAEDIADMAAGFTVKVSCWK